MYFNPNDIGAYRNRSQIYRVKGEYDSAIAEANQALRLEPKDDTAFVLRGIAQSRKGNMDEALDDYQQALKINPRSGYTYTCMGFTHFLKKEFDQAFEDLQTASSLDTENEHHILPVIAVTQSARGESEAALNLWRQVCAQKPNYKDADWLRDDELWPEAMIAEADKLTARL